MPLRIQFGDPKGGVNAFCYVPLGRCKLARIAAFAEPSGVSRLFYRALLESLRVWAPSTYLQITSSDSWWGRRRADLKLAPKPPIYTTSNTLLYEIDGTDDLIRFISKFWYRSPLRLYGVAQRTPAITALGPLVDQQLLDACKLVAAEELRFVAERDTWGFFPNVLLAAVNAEVFADRARDAAKVLGSPLRCDESAFIRFPISIPARGDAKPASNS
jgi:hypothetical protein